MYFAETLLFLGLAVVVSLIVHSNYILNASRNTKIFVKNNMYVDESREKWINQLERASKEILIVAGELSPAVYSDSYIINLFKQKALQGLLIKIIFGPNYDSDELLRIDGIKFFKSKVRQPFHFRLIDGKYVFFEHPHIRGAKYRNVVSVDNSVYWCNNLRKLFNEIIHKKEAVPFEIEADNA